MTVGTAFLAGCAGETDNGQAVVYDDMKAAFEQSGLRSVNIGIFSKTVSNNTVSYGEGGSGVIFTKDGETYYALTAAHVVSVENAQLLVFTINTDMKSEEIPGVNMNVLATEVYDAMYPAELVYSSQRDDLAVIRFSSNETLSVATLAETGPKVDDRILCVGNPQNEWFAVSYGKVTSGIETFGKSKGFPSNAMRHSAYIQVGSSGGAAFNEKMQLVGTTPGVSFSLDGKDFRYGVLIPVSEIQLCLQDWGG